MNKKIKKIVICVILILLIILLFPIRMNLKDGGSVKYKSLLYTIIDYHSFDGSGYTEGIEIQILGITIYRNLHKEQSSYIKVEDEIANSKMKIVLSLEDKIQNNTVWCGTFNLIWNDLKNDLAKQDIVFTPQLDIVNNLNKGTFTLKELSENSYYKVYGHPSLELKKEIEQAIKKKFNEKSDILDSFDWNSNNPKDYFLYAMLKKDFNFPKEFAQLQNGKFKEYQNVKYFGINNKTNDTVRNQVKVLYYNSENDFAIQLITKEKDDIIIAKGNNETTFDNMYKNIKEQENNYQGNKNIAKNETVAIPNISFDLKEEIKEIENKPFFFSNGDSYEITQALQTIKFDLDKKGGRIKSEAGIMNNESAIEIPEKPREFLVNDTFTIFLKENDKNLPYFAAKISDISQVQNGIEKSTTYSTNINAENTSFLGTILEENMQYILVEPNENESIRNVADKIQINIDQNRDYFYGEGRKIIVNFDGKLINGDVKQINSCNILLNGYENFELEIKKSARTKTNKILNNKDLSPKFNSDFDLYYYGLDEVNVNINDIGKKMPLETALKQGYITLDGIVHKANKDFPNANVYDDGGSIEYHYKDYSIIKKHTLDGNRDVYIGIPEMNLNKI